MHARTTKDQRLLVIWLLVPCSSCFWDDYHNQPFWEGSGEGLKPPMNMPLHFGTSLHSKYTIACNTVWSLFLVFESLKRKLRRSILKLQVSANDSNDRIKLLLFILKRCGSCSLSITQRSLKDFGHQPQDGKRREAPAKHQCSFKKWVCLERSDTPNKCQH